MRQAESRAPRQRLRRRPRANQGHLGSFSGRKSARLHACWPAAVEAVAQRQHLYFCVSKASKLSLFLDDRALGCMLAGLQEAAQR